MEASSLLNPAQGIPAKYGRACTNCQRVKSRCFYRVDEDNCERCHRLKKECQPSAPARKRNSKKTPGSRTAQLEGKLDDIVSLLRSQSTASPSQSIPHSTYQEASSGLNSLLTPESVSTSSPNNFPDNFNPTGIERNAPPTPSSTGFKSSTDVPSTPFSDGAVIYKIPDGTAEEQLDDFRRSFLSFFPFVHIPDEMSSYELRFQKPFLWLVIMSLTTKSVAQQLAMGDTIRQIVSQKVIAEHEKSLDVLLGMICYLAWFQYHKKDKSYLVMWTQIAVALVFELGIHRHPPKEPGEEGQFSSRAVWFPPRLPVSKTRTLEERRTVLGTFLISSMVWTSLRQMEPLSWTPYLDDCVRVISQGAESERDILLTSQVKCYVIMNQMTRAPAEQLADGENFKAPPPYFVNAMRLQLQDIKKSLPNQLQTNRTALLNLYGTEVIIQEALLSRPKTQDQTGLSDLQRLEGLDSILTAIERWLEVFFSIPLSDWPGTTFGIFAQLSHCVILLFKLTTLDEPGWDTNEVKKRANLFDVLERLAQLLDDIPCLLGLVDAVGTGESGHLFKAPRMIRGMNAGFVAEFAALVPREMRADVQPEGNPLNNEIMGELSIPDEFAMMLAEDPWFTDMFSMHNI